MFRRLWTLVPVITEVYPHLTRSSPERAGRPAFTSRASKRRRGGRRRRARACPTTTGRDFVRHRRDRAPSRPRATEKKSTNVPIRKTRSRPTSSRLVKCATRPASHLMTMTRATSPILQKRSIPSSSFAAHSVRSPRNYRTRSSPPARAHSSQPHRPVGAKSAARGGPCAACGSPSPIAAAKHRRAGARRCHIDSRAAATPRASPCERARWCAAFFASFARVPSATPDERRRPAPPRPARPVSDLRALRRQTI